MTIDHDTLLRLANGLRTAETRWRMMDGLCDPDDGPALEVDMLDGWVDGYAAAIASVLGGITGAEVRGIAHDALNDARDAWTSEPMRRAHATNSIARQFKALA
jgi:hypothetical protein